MKYPWDDKNIWYLPNEKAAFLKGVQAGRDAQRESDAKICRLFSQCYEGRNGEAEIINNTGEI